MITAKYVILTSIKITTYEKDIGSAYLIVWNIDSSIFILKL